MTTINLHAETRRLLLDRPPGLSLTAIAAATGLGVEWIRKLAYDDSIDPGVKKVQTLYDYLTRIDRDDQPPSEASA